MNLGAMISCLCLIGAEILAVCASVCLSAGDKCTATCDRTACAVVCALCYVLLLGTCTCTVDICARATAGVLRYGQCWCVLQGLHDTNAVIRVVLVGFARML